MFNKIVTAILIIFVNFWTIAQHNTPEEIVKEYYEALLNDNWEKIAELTHPDEMSLFRKNLKRNNYEVIASKMGTTTDSLQNLSNSALYVIFLHDLYLNVPTVKAKENKFILGTIYENKDSAYVIYKGENYYTNIIQLINFKNEWKMKLDYNIRIMFIRPNISIESLQNDKYNSQSDHNEYKASESFANSFNADESLKTIMKSVSEVMKDNNFINSLATFNKKYYDALINEGFTKDQALQIVSGIKSPFLK